MHLIALGLDGLKITDAGRNRLAADEAHDARREREPAGLRLADD